MVRVVWHFVNALLFESSLNPSSSLKIALLKLFGAKVGRRVIIKPGVNIKHPWFLTLGDDTWIGERAWIDNTFAPMTLGSHVCVSQGRVPLHGQPRLDGSGLWAFGAASDGLKTVHGSGQGAKVLPGAIVASHVVGRGRRGAVEADRAVHDLRWQPGAGGQEAGDEGSKKAQEAEAARE